eukprot:TRINITY_DN12523_c0_g1_i1.p1 TRINITY_DN12523_c0_g1~~TRINITY_DN12523_c0_g1_i1.p1  ORF type:complete len:515 (-),score=46.57 TRINITY_DN12523_c0_g1_i1:163-1707(-)
MLPYTALQEICIAHSRARPSIDNKVVEDNYIVSLPPLRITRKRPYSRRLLFLDLLHPAISSLGEYDQARRQGHTGTAVGIPAVLKDPWCPGVEDYIHSLKVGDIVCVSGLLAHQGGEHGARQSRASGEEGRAPTLQFECLVTAIQVREKWNTGELDLPFTPIALMSTSAGQLGGSGHGDKCGDAQGGGPGQVGVGRPAELPLCRDWVNRKQCPRGEHCHYSHGNLQDVDQQVWAQQRRVARRERHQLPQDTLDPHSKLHKSQRARVFAAWLVEHLPSLRQSQQCTSGEQGVSRTRLESVQGRVEGEGQQTVDRHVVDIGGGKGELAFEMACSYRLPVTVIDPRRPKLSKLQQRRWKTCQADPTWRPLAPISSQPAQEREEGSAPASGSTLPSPHPHPHPHSEPWPFTHLQRELHPDDLPGPSMSSTVPRDLAFLTTATVIACMHPDAATEPALDIALTLSRPYAIVPCCIFPSSGHRMSWDAFIAHLKSKDPGMQEAYLNFEGKNMVLYNFNVT